MEKQCINCDVGTDFLYTIQANLMFIILSEILIARLILGKAFVKVLLASSHLSSSY